MTRVGSQRYSKNKVTIEGDKEGKILGRCFMRNFIFNEEGSLVKKKISVI
jgi:hypothetical protein